MKKTLILIACASLAQLTATHASGYLDESLDGRLDEIRDQNERISRQLRDERDAREADREAQRHADFMNNGW
jgi:hypothetical protein